MRAYLIQDFTRDCVKVCEIEYEKETDKMLMGVKRVADLIGESYYIPSRVDKDSVCKDLPTALHLVRARCVGRLEQEESTIAKIDLILADSE